MFRKDQKKCIGVEERKLTSEWFAEIHLYVHLAKNHCNSINTIIRLTVTRGRSVNRNSVTRGSRVLTEQSVANQLIARLCGLRRTGRAKSVCLHAYRVLHITNTGNYCERTVGTFLRNARYTRSSGSYRMHVKRAGTTIPRNIMQRAS